MEPSLPTPSFYRDSHLSQLSKESHFLFTPSPHGRIQERRMELERYLNDHKLLPIALTASGLNCVVPLSRVIRSSCSSKVTIESSLTFNGVPVLIKGEIDTLTLEGTISAREDPHAIPLSAEVMHHLSSIHNSLGIRPPS
ncbi:hypothetical protein PMAYCL1PPCAC_23457 [Pristionchus mayeri]|uniref:Uncharacterized protein n=1 Tax=Pristionchus mayeri TaxID=1317129 RepID=A0AAN5I5L8_9BILA|nr:hypothetical protein PMAYCL1PPCAC_23457 [Pristionchus mayeri]